MHLGDAHFADFSHMQLYFLPNMLRYYIEKLFFASKYHGYTLDS